MHQQFLQRMEDLLQQDYPAFEKLLGQPRSQGLRLNTHKLTQTQLKQDSGIELDEPVPFANNAWYIHQKLGLHPLWQTGAIYLQEPSAMAPVSLLDIQPDNKVLDLCAAPGSKSTQILNYLDNGFLLANEYDLKRAQILLSNLERAGAVDFAVTSMDTQTLCRQLPGFFDRVLVDAPCSGEGMMRKHETAIEQWSQNNILQCARRQEQILDNAAEALKPGGILVYSTCTYAPEENEQTVKSFLDRHPEMEQIRIEVNWGREDLDHAGARRIFPMDGGDGHFMAKFRKKGREAAHGKIPQYKNEMPDRNEQEFLQSQLEETFPCHHHANGKLYAMHHPFLKLKKGTVLRQGILVGETVKNRFEPAHAFFLSTPMLQSKTKTELDLHQLDQFLHGQQLPLKETKGWRTLCWNGLPAGFGKSTGTAINNRLPKGLRLQPASHLKDL